MEWRENGGVEWLEARMPGARAAFATRGGGVSEAPYDGLNLGILTEDDRESVLENRRRFAVALDREPGGIVVGRQVHGAELAIHAGPQAPCWFTEPGDAIPAVDGHVVTDPGLAALVFVADCLPVALAGPGGVAMLHCGWRGLAAGIVARGVTAVDATDAAIGPGIGSCCYEVGDEVLSAFAGLGEGIAADRMLDLAEVARRLLLEAGVERVTAAGVCTSCDESHFFSHRRDAGRTGRQAGLVWLVGRLTMPGLIHGLDPAKIAANLTQVRDRVGDGVEILAASKYVPLEEMGALAEAGVGLIGENRQQDLAAKHERWGDTFQWDFIGGLQSRKVKGIVPLCRLIHSVATDSALEQLGRHGDPDTEVLVQVNVAGEDGKAGIAPGDLGAFIERCPVRVSGLMTMPPFSTDPEDSRPHFAHLAELAATHGLSRLSMGTSQDWPVAVEEGATIIRLGTTLYM